MSDQRIDALESSQAILNKIASEQLVRLRDIEHNETMLLGMAQSQGLDIKAIQSDISSIKGDVKAIESAIQLLTANILNLRTELLVVKSLVNQIAENTGTKLEEED